MRLVLIGASGHGKVCAEIAKLSGRYDDIIFLDDDPLLQKCGAYDVRGTGSEFYQYLNEQIEFFVSIGNHEHRRRIQEKIENAGGRVATLFHPKAIISETTTLGTGTVVMPGAVINADVQIGKGVIVNTSSSVDHDCEIGDWSHIAVGAHICGMVGIGNECWIGAGTIVSNNISICNNCVTGAGAVVVKNIDVPGIYVGIPARRNEKK